MVDVVVKFLLFLYQLLLWFRFVFICLRSFRLGVEVVICPVTSGLLDVILYVSRCQKILNLTFDVLLYSIVAAVDVAVVRVVVLVV